MFIPDRAPRVLAIGAHPDDIELGAGGFLHRLARRHQATIDFLIFTEGLRGLDAGAPNSAEMRRREAEDAADDLGVGRECVEVLEYPDGQLHEHGHHLIHEIERRVDGGESKYDMVLTHCCEDAHADHRAVHESTLSAVRYFHGSVLMYQSPSVKPNGFRPTFFARLDEVDMACKEKAIQAHVSQRGRSYTRVTRTRGLADSWAIFLRQAEGTYLEAFEVYKSFF